MLSLKLFKPYAMDFKTERAMVLLYLGYALGSGFFNYYFCLLS